MTPRPSRRPATTVSRSGTARVPDPLNARAIVDAAGSGAVAALVTWAITAIPVLLAWSLGVPRRAGFGQAAAVSVDVWAMAHHASITADGLVITFAPLLLTALYWYVCLRAWRWLAGAGGPARDWLGAGCWEPAVGVAGYAVTGLLLVILGNLGAAQILWWSALPGVIVLPAAAALPVALRASQRPGWAEAATSWWVRSRYLPDAWRPAGWGLAAALLGGLGLFGVILAARQGRVMALHDALQPDTTGTVVLALGQVLAIPNLAAWALGWSGGATVHVGEASVSLSGAQAGTLPMLPVLGVLPDGGTLPGYLWLALLVPVSAGVVMGLRIPRASLLEPMAHTIATALLAAILAGAGLVVLSWLALSGAAPGGLARIGTEPWVTGGLVAGEMAAGAVLTVLVRRGFVGWRG